MKQNCIFKLMLMGACLLFLDACTDIVPIENPIDEIVDNQETRIEVLGLNMGADTKVTLTGTTFAWQPGDTIAVWTGATDKDNNGSYKKNVVAADLSLPVTLNAGEYRFNYAIYPASAASLFYSDSKTVYVRLPISYKLSEVENNTTPLPMIAENDKASNSLTFYNVAGLLRLTVNGIPTDNGTYLKIDFHNKVSGDFKVTSSDGTIGLSEITTPYESYIHATDTLVITELKGKSSVTINLPLPAITYSDITVSAWNSSNVPVKACVEVFNYTAAREHGKTKEVSLANGVFQYAAHKYFMIAPANLQYSNGTFSFHENAYDMTFTTNVYSGTTEEKSARDALFNSSGTFDLFAWGASGYSNITPWGTDYSGNLDLGDADWGNFNSVGPYAKGTWQTPSRVALDYLFSDRTSYYSKASFGTVNNVPGLIILPDQFVDPQKNNGNAAIKSTHSDYTSNVYTAEDWVYMQTAGAAFLPCAGKTHYSEYLNSRGYYWTSTGEYSGDGGGNGYADRAYYLNFGLSLQTPIVAAGIKLYDSGNSTGKIKGFEKRTPAAVRLVHYIR